MQVRIVADALKIQLELLDIEAGRDTAGKV
jgi:hypothetical protein